MRSNLDEQDQNPSFYGERAFLHQEIKYPRQKYNEKNFFPLTMIGVNMKRLRIIRLLMKKRMIFQKKKVKITIQ